jgi:DNA-binding beta-propeller fold protein YncE
MISAAAALAHAAGEPLLQLTATIALPMVKGRIDHLDVDREGHRLFIAALGNNTVEVLDIAASRHIRTVQGFGEPQGLAYVPEANRLYVANGSADRLDVLDGVSLAALERVTRLDDADNVRYDRSQRTVVVGYGKGALRIVDTASGQTVGDIPLPGHPESFQIEQTGSRVFVNVPSAGNVTVVDRVKREAVATWQMPEARANFPMALDEESRRLFVGTRSPAMMLVYDIDSGGVVAKLPIGGDTDDIFVDSEHRRVYVICGEGRVDIFRAEGRDQYVSEGSIQTAPRARTGLFVRENGTLYVAAPATGTESARVLVYRTR